MTYHSDTLAFKKSELLEVLQAIDSNFSFDENNSSKGNNTANSKHKNIIEYVPNHLRVLALSDYFSIVEAACFISQDEPAKIQALLDSGDLNYDAWRYGEHIQAVKVIENGIKASKLEVDSEGQIPRLSLQYFLHDRGYTVSGFNDKLPEQELIGCGTPSIKQTSPNNQEIEQLRAELIQAQERIKQLEAEKQENTISHELTGIEKLNQSAKDRQGMARVIAMKLWKDDHTILIGDMADKVYRVMAEYCVSELPDNRETIKNWIRPIATSQAQRRGRPPKKSTT